MTELLTAAQMRAIEAAAIASGEVTGLELMERAGAGVVAAVLEEWPELALTAHRAVVLCGPGGNGGDGFVVARLLRERGWEVEVFLYGDPERMPPDTRVNYERWRGMGEVRSLINHSRIDALKMRPGEQGVLFDAVFGIGLARALEEDLRLAISGFHSRVPLNFLRSVAVDVPSGICADSGRAIVGPKGCSLEWRYDLVVTFHRLRVGHCLRPLSRRVVIKDIGLNRRTAITPELRTGLAELGQALQAGADLASLIDWDAEIASAQRIGQEQTATVRLLDGYDAMVDKAESGGDHKYTHGHALILSGPPGRTGAARLAARGALRVGAGVVTVGAVAGAMAEHAARLDAVMLREVADGAALAELLEDRRINALCLGPGLGLDARAAGLVAAALGAPVPGLTRDLSQPSERRPEGGPGSSPGRGQAETRRATVLDADALTLLARDPALFARLHDRCILTPHAGEFARLFPGIAAKLAEPATKGPAYSKVDATREAAARAGCVVLYKGPDTVIADPSGRCSINSAHYDRAAPWLATAGSGDVLAGFIAGLLARGFVPMQAAETAAWLHVECALKFGPGLIAEDLPEMLPQVFRSLGVT